MLLKNRTIFYIIYFFFHFNRFYIILVTQRTTNHNNIYEHLIHVDIFLFCLILISSINRQSILYKK
ncbi:hypothetical protein C923_00172 [Plasmodium falciparum UGT5.1]|uniref:Uncharacterized protein n=2 Tax=Plasmodium falciparum TaxID=5833 RepID=A0A024XEP7_PLAFC|nr:hypothetical protein PFMC_00154 [Plasmodium falciparum CAMP/Malaysia]EWC79152.1 hypothetical protein C923_00172 [Plasmodium falciparum UGT5.1]